MIKARSPVPQPHRRVVRSHAYRWGSRDDFDLTNGWISAGRGEPYERDASAVWKEGYLLRVISRMPKPKVAGVASRLGKIH
jgi:hypothetical protein